ncbi:MBL fold metallo-hydrolase [Mesohalobacter halotolerans]|uniref:MBL fold metallo-hydrolase n=1 Tax=Mesohalobacter halotolerans TaxID=1883405 RepID=A0A4U5TPC9_9FLAO|nr:rhodanese-like domain-containing protein [Mesohalobacter halotolerans]MBS3739355.1 MBL fold metallo-hydrolase [Psychroflexus sp.]TKS55960.1 MBL fold metallo-hydrolase [Mesohalobacter halotolerans]
MQIKQFTDKALAHYSYAILSGEKIALIDPARNPQPYYEFAEKHNAKIVAVFETHPHADFISSHYQIHKETDAKIYVSKDLGAEYPHETFDEGDKLTLNDVQFSAINTPGHSPDSICILADHKETSKKALFTGDTLFIGDVGRPDLREDAGNMKATRESLAKAMYHTVQNKFSDLPDETLIYPAHGAGSLCGKNMSDASSSTLGNERVGNWAFKIQTEVEFVNELLNDQPFIPSYFGFNVDTNKGGPENFMSSIWSVPLKLSVSNINKDHLIIDTRDFDNESSHLPNSINIMARDENDTFETWLGAIVKPNEKFYLVINSVQDYQYILDRVARIGYENQIVSVITLAKNFKEHTKTLDLKKFKSNPDDYTIIDIRNHSEVSDGKYFENALHYPLNNLRENAKDISVDKPIVVHCAGGYRSRAGFGIIKNMKPDAEVYDLSFAVSDFSS